MSYQEQVSARVHTAVTAGKYVVIQPTFPTIPDSYEPNLSNLNERNGLADVFGTAVGEWTQNHHRQHEMFRVGTLEKLAAVAKAFKEEGASTERLMVSKHRCVVPWSTFYPDDQEGQRTTRSPGTLHVRQLFFALNNNAARQSYKNLVPSLAPALRTNLSATDTRNGKPLRTQHLSTDSLRQMTYRGETVGLRDMLVVPDQDLKARILEAPSFSFVATPYLQRWSLGEGVESAKEFREAKARGENPDIAEVRPVCMFWHISDERQLILGE